MKHNLNDIWEDKKGELYIKTIEGTKSYYRFLVQEYLGFEIPKGYVVHHINWNHRDNRLENFLLIPTPLHVWIHRTKGTKDLFSSNLEKIKREGFNQET